MTRDDLIKADLPDSPGVYFFYDEFDNVLYIGKATSLKDRTKSYFTNDLIETRGLKIVNMVLSAKYIKYQTTESVLEALLLENNLIKKHQPIFNTKEKDDKSYTCVVITKEDYPRILSMRVREYEKRYLSDSSIEKVDKVYGPFSSASQIREAMRMIRKIFPYRDKCEVGQMKPCFNAQIKLCPGCCVGAINAADYKETIKHIKDLFEGKLKKIKKDLDNEMNKAAKEERFEKAASVRNTIWALNHVRDVSLIKDEDIIDFKNNDYRIEAYDVAHISGTSRVGVMVVVEGGKKVTDEYRKFKLIENINDDYAGIIELLSRRLKHKEWRMPDLIVIDGGAGQKNIAEEYLSKNNILIRLVSVVKDDKHKAREILGIDNIINTKLEKEKLTKSIILANSEAHRFAINYHKKERDQNFLL